MGKVFIVGVFLIVVIWDCIGYIFLFGIVIYVVFLFLGVFVFWGGA